MQSKSRAAGTVLTGLLLMWTWLGWPCLRSFAAEDAVEVRQMADAVTIANACLRIDFSLSGSRMRTTRLENRRTGLALDLDGDDFRIELTDGHSVRSFDLGILHL